MQIRRKSLKYLFDSSNGLFHEKLFTAADVIVLCKKVHLLIVSDTSANWSIMLLPLFHLYMCVCVFIHILTEDLSATFCIARK